MKLEWEFCSASDSIQCHLSSVIRPACFQGLHFEISHLLKELSTEKPFFIFHYLGERLAAAGAQAQTYQMNGSNFWGQYLLGFIPSKQGLNTQLQMCPGVSRTAFYGIDPTCFANEAFPHGRIKKAALGVRPKFHFSGAIRAYSW